MTPTTPALSDEGLITRLTNLYAALASQTKSYDAEAVVEAIAALKARPPVKGDSVELVERLRGAILRVKDRYGRYADIPTDELVEAALEASGHTALSERVVVLEGERNGLRNKLERIQRWLRLTGSGTKELVAEIDAALKGIAQTPPESYP